MRPSLPALIATPVTALLFACSAGAEPGEGAPPTTDHAATAPAGDPAALLEAGMRQIDAEAARIDSIFQPLPLLRPAQEETLRRFSNAQQLERARALGIGRLLPPAELERLRSTGSLVPLEDTEHWVVRDLDHSSPLAVPGVPALLTRIGTRFHARLAELGAPAYRMEVSSVLRTAENQAALRRVNPNAALGESTHEYGTTIDILYSAFAAPLEPIARPTVTGAEWLEPHLLHHAAVAAERVAGRRALELRAVLGQVLIQMQLEGEVMVTLERLQPVFHMTITRAR